MSSARWRKVSLLAAISVSAVFASVGCRAVLGIEDEPPGGDTVDGAVDEPPIDVVALDGGGDGRVRTYCDSVEPRPVFCADFDRGDVLTGWSNANRTPDIGQSGGGTITAEVSAFRSEPRAAYLHIPPLVTSSQSASAILVVTLDDIPAAGATITFDLRLDTELFPEGQGIYPLLTVELESPGKESIMLVRRASGVYLVSTPDAVPVNAPLPVGVWKSIELEIDRRAALPDAGDVDSGDAGGGIAQLRYDVLNVASVRLPSSARSASTLRVILGPISRGPLGAVGVYVDNVRISDRVDL